jgi:hypothetical protein
VGGFVIGSVVGALHLPWWTNELPSHAPVSLTEVGGGYLGAWAISLAVMALVVGLTLVIGRRGVPPVEAPPAARGALRGSWPLWVGALLLAGLNALTLRLQSAPTSAASPPSACTAGSGASPPSSAPSPAWPSARRSACATPSPPTPSADPSPTARADR